MKITIKETILNTYDLNNNLLNSMKDIVYAITPEKGYVLRDKIRNKIIKGTITVPSKLHIKNFEELKNN